MASPKRRQAPDELELCLLSDFHLLHNFTDLVCREHSLQAKGLACEIMRRFTATRVEQPFPACGKPSVLGDARWGDAKRVYQIFGLKRGPLDRIRKARLIESRSLDEDQDEEGSAAVRAKRLYDLISIEEFLRSPEGKKFVRKASVTSTTIKKPDLTIMRK
jgi:hypothetical protein